MEQQVRTNEVGYMMAAVAEVVAVDMLKPERKVKALAAVDNANHSYEVEIIYIKYLY